jgi:hypothetical protein
MALEAYTNQLTRNNFMSITAEIVSQLTVRELLDVNVPAASNPTVVHSAFNTTKSLGAATAPPASKVAAFLKALVAGVATIDLTALTGTGGVAVNGTGLKVQAIKIINPSTNTHLLTVAPGASNGHNLLGATFLITLYPGEEFLFVGNDHASKPDIGATSKNLDISDGGSGGTESHDFLIVMG